MKFKTMHPLMFVGGPKKLRSDDACLVETDDPKQIAFLKVHPYCKAVESEKSDGDTNAGRIAGPKGRNRSAVDEPDKTSN